MSGKLNDPVRAVRLFARIPCEKRHNVASLRIYHLARKEERERERERKRESDAIRRVTYAFI